jgi:hypothetical protein
MQCVMLSNPGRLPILTQYPPPRQLLHLSRYQPWDVTCNRYMRVSKTKNCRIFSVGCRFCHWWHGVEQRICQGWIIDELFPRNGDLCGVAKDCVLGWQKPLERRVNDRLMILGARFTSEYVLPGYPWKASLFSEFVWDCTESSSFWIPPVR